MDMYSNARLQLADISVSQVKDLFKRLYPAKHDKLIIDDKLNLKRTDFYYSELSYLIADRKITKITFPLFNELKRDFAIFESGSVKFGSKAILPDVSIIQKFEGSPGAKRFDVPFEKIQDAFDFPFEIERNAILKQQRPYFLSNYSFQQQCKNCEGNKYVVCKNPECQGKHTWNCPICHKKGNVPCSKCNGHGYVTCGNGFSIGSCNGTGKITKRVNNNGQLKSITERCPTCKGKGEVPCNKCGASGRVTCSKCHGYGDITCKYCYGDTHRYGMIDCQECLATGIMAQFVFIETTIDEYATNNLSIKGKGSDIPDNAIKEHLILDSASIIAYQNLNGSIQNNTDDISSELLKEYEHANNLHKDSFPMLLKEELKYQIIPCVQFPVKHILTNTFHDVVMFDFWDRPEVFFLTDPEKTKTNFRSVTQTTVGLLSKILKTKGFKKKEDKKIEIKLLIYLAKVDGKIQEEEKTFLTEHISNLDDFTNTEKKQLFNLLNSVELPELTSKELKFSNPSRGKEVIEELIQLANADGVFELSERNFIAKVKQILENQFN